MKNYCRSCREETSLHEKGICPWCDTPLTERLGRHGALTDQHLHVLRELNKRGVTMKRIAELNYKTWGYSSVNTCCNAISLGWKRLGVNVYSQGSHVRQNEAFSGEPDQLVTSRSQPGKTGA